MRLPHFRHYDYLAPRRMKNYESIEQECDERQSRILYRFRLSPLNFRFPFNRNVRFHTSANKSREYAYRIRYTDEEILTVASNRINMAEAENAHGFSWVNWFARRREDENDSKVEMIGQELQALQRLADKKVDDEIVGHHVYRVRLAYLKELFAVASQSTSR